MPERVGVYVCHCGINIAAGVDVEDVAEFSEDLPNVVVARHYLYMCSEPGQALIKEDIEELGLTRVVVASCSPRMHEPTFRGAIGEKGLNPYEFDQANIREQCSWVNPPGEPATTKAKELVAAAVARVAWLEPLEERTVTVRPAALVIGGGVAGMTAAKDIADAGFQVTLVERRFPGHAGGAHLGAGRAGPAAVSHLPDGRVGR
jgi:heterodisulfide reductase subunit A